MKTKDCIIYKTQNPLINMNHGLEIYSKENHKVKQFITECNDWFIKIKKELNIYLHQYPLCDEYTKNSDYYYFQFWCTFPHKELIIDFADNLAKKLNINFKIQ